MIIEYNDNLLKPEQTPSQVIMDNLHWITCGRVIGNFLPKENLNGGSWVSMCFFDCNDLKMIYEFKKK